MPFENQSLWASKLSSISKRALKLGNILSQIADSVSITASDYNIMKLEINRRTYS